MISVSAVSPPDIPAVESVYADAVAWTERAGLALWPKESVSWAGLTGRYGYRPEDFRLACLDGVPAGCMILMDRDPLFWPEIEKGRSLYIHKLAVKRSAAKKGVSTALMDYAKAECARRGAADLRLTTDAGRPKLMKFYEDAGFFLARREILFGSYDTAFYVWTPMS